MNKPESRRRIVSLLRSDQIRWQEILPGVQRAVLAGEPEHRGSEFVVRYRLPDGFEIPPHWHPEHEHVTVIEGTFLMGFGETFQRAKMRALAAGSYVYIPKRVRHYTACRGVVVVQAHGKGPFKIVYVNPKDDPARKLKGK